ncbi:MAG TPA: glycosyltransferase [Chitinophagaceae bacterium]|nr:glycosyltransferase [Chitinophagaceae bacterium]
MKSILYISYDGLTDPLGQSQILPYLVRLSTRGFRFTILSFEKRNRYAADRHLVEEIMERAGIEWVPLKFTRRPPLLAKVYDRWRLRRMANRLQRRRGFDLVHCRSYVAAEIGLWLKKKFGSRFLFDMRGFWADEKVDNGQWKLSNPLFRRVYAHYKKKEKEFLRNADGIISLTEAGRRELLRTYQGLSIDVIPCCADLVHFNYANIRNGVTEALRAQLGLDSRHRVLTYLGSVGGWYMMDEMLAFFRRLLLRHPEFVLLILTKDDRESVFRAAEATGVPGDKIRVLYSGRKELPDYLSLSDCSVFFIRPSYSKIASSPTKHGELMSMGIPVICNNVGDTGAIINRTGTGVIVREFSDSGYDKVISRMEDLLAIPKKRIREAAQEIFDLREGVNRYAQVYERIFQ